MAASPGAPQNPASDIRALVAEPTDAWVRAARFVPLACALAHLALGLVVLYRAHPAEDAYILFDYVKNLVAGHGIVYWPGGPHAEGATDFLWMIAIAGLVKIGCDVAVAAVLLNATGAGIASFVCVRAVLRAGARGPAAFVLSLSTFVFACGAGALASYVGFSATAYSALALLLFSFWVDTPPGRISWILWIGLAIALFRPDGVILAAGFALLGLFRARSEGGLARYLRAAGTVVLAGAAYALARWRYFGLILPLPLYVKGHSAAGLDLARGLSDPMGEIPGLSPTFAWVRDPIGAWPLLLGILVLLPVVRLGAGLGAGEAGRFKTRTLLSGSLPFAAHVAALCFAQQSQNFAYRFHAPAHAALFFLLLVLAARVAATARSARSRPWEVAVCAAATLCVVPGFFRSANMLPWLWRQHTYVDSFAPKLGAVLAPGRTIALTEAGRLSYWTHARVEDIVGLNNPHTARIPPDLAYLRSIDPDIVMFYSAAEVFGFGRRLPLGPRDPVVPLDVDLLTDIPDPRYRDVFERDLPDWVPGVIPGRVASLKLARFLVESHGYDLYAVRYASRYEHVWALRRGLPEAPAILAALRSATADEDYRTYAQTAGLWFASPHRH